MNTVEQAELRRLRRVVKKEHAELMYLREMRQELLTLYPRVAQMIAFPADDPEWNREVSAELSAFVNKHLIGRG